jgi:hypothetical protein
MPGSWWDASHTHIHSWDDQRVRQSRAVHIYVEPELFCHDDLSANINGFDVTLDYCTCPDFDSRRFPCKHMYRLAHEYGFFDLGSHIMAAQQVISTLPSYSHYAPPQTPNQAYQVQYPIPVDSAARSHRHGAIILALLFGGVGAHLFYLRKPLLAVLCIAGAWTCISGIVALIQAIAFASTSDAEWRATNMPSGSSYGKDLHRLLFPNWNKLTETTQCTLAVVYVLVVSAIVVLFIYFAST